MPVRVHSEAGPVGTRRLGSATVAIGVAAILASVANAAEVRVMVSGGLSAACRELLPEFERASGDQVITAFGPSMGTTWDAIPARLARGEPVDVLIMSADALGDLIKRAKVVDGSRTDLAWSPIGVAVRAGAPKPDIGSVDALKRTLLAAKSLAYSDSASGVYLETQLFGRLGIADQMKGKRRMSPDETVGEAVARGEAEIGFQQISEWNGVEGIDLVGPLPSEVQKMTLFSAGIAVGARQPAAGRALIAFLASPAAAIIVTNTGLYPVASAERN